MKEVKVRNIYILVDKEKIVAIRLELEDGQQLIIPIEGEIRELEEGGKK